MEVWLGNKRRGREEHGGWGRSIYRCEGRARTDIHAFNGGVGYGPPNLAPLKGAQLMIK